MRPLIGGRSAVAALCLLAACTAGTARVPDPAPRGSASSTSVAPPSTVVASTVPPSAPSTRPTTTTVAEPDVLVPLDTVGRPWGAVDGLLAFRGNPTRTWYGRGLPDAPVVRWRFPERPMCGPSTVGGQTTTWCGTGWTGQPAVRIGEDGRPEVIVGAYDHAVHFVDGWAGVRTREDLATGDLIKGSVSLDPDGFPLLYVGSRDDLLRVVALDRERPVVLWSLDAEDHPGIWNDDWDGNPLVIDDVLYVGGENGFLFAIRLHRGYAEEGQVTVAPEIVGKVRGWDRDLLSKVGDRNASIEASVVVGGDTVYFANSAGRVAGVDARRLASGMWSDPDAFDDGWAFDVWLGDDIDATPVMDGDGALYVGVELERLLPRSAEVGQLVKLRPDRPDDPIAWSVAVPPRLRGDVGGIWATPALGVGVDGRPVVYAATHPGELLAVDAATGTVLWRDEIGHHAWSSPVVVGGDVLVAVDCETGGGLRRYAPDGTIRWEVPLGSGCIESTPAVLDGWIYVGSRDGFLYAFADPDA